MDENILEQIRNRVPQLSKSQKKIAHYMIENPDDAAFMTAAQIGRAIGVSESTVVRFAGAMGYEGFPEFQNELETLVRGRLKSVDRIDISAAMSQSKILPYVMQSDADRILSTMKDTDGEAFDAAVELISEAKTVYVIGVRSCAPLAEFFAFYLRMIVEHVVAVTTNSSSEMFEQMIRTGEDDVVIGISFPRYSMRTLKAMEFANDRNAKVIAITDNIHSPMNLYSSCNLFARSEMASVIDSLTAPLSLINALLVALSVRKADVVLSNLKTLDEVWDDYQVTNNDEINYLDDRLMKELKGLDNPCQK